MPINQLKAGALLNYVVLGLNNLVGLLYMPYMLRMMGRSEFGLYSLVASVIAYLTVMDFGFGNAIIRYTAKFRAEGKQEEQYAMFGMFLILYVAIGALVFLAGTALYLNAEHLFGETLTPYELGRAKILMIIMILNLAVTFPLGIFGAIVTAYEDFVFQKAVQIVRIVLNTAVMICLLKMGYRRRGDGRRADSIQPRDAAAQLPILQIQDPDPDRLRQIPLGIPARGGDLFVLDLPPGRSWTASTGTRDNSCWGPSWAQRPSPSSPWPSSWRPCTCPSRPPFQASFCPGSPP